MIRNVPEYAKDHKYLVVRLIDDEMWFWSAHDTRAEAGDVAVEVDGYVITQ